MSKLESSPKKVIVLGGSGMLGRRVCEALLNAGAQLGFTYKTGQTVADDLLARFPQCHARKVDVMDLPALFQACDELGDALSGVDALVHAVGIGSTCEPGGFDKIEDIDPEGWDRLCAVNVRSAFFAVQRLLPRLCASKGNIVLMGSIDGLRSVPAPVHYGSSKGALRSMVLALCKELGNKGVKVNMVAPGVLEGGLSRTMPSELRAEYIKHCGMKRMGRHEEAASLVAYLALENTYMSGQALIADGAL